MSIERGRTRQSGETAANEEAAAAVAEAGEEDHALPELPEEKRFTFRTPGFSRMRTSWNPQDSIVIQSAQERVEKLMLDQFADAYSVMWELYEIIRTPATDSMGHALTDAYGLPQWTRSPSGAYIEDWTNLTRAHREHFLFLITTHLFEWSQRAANAWGEAMFAKAQWEERYAIGFEQPVAGTVDDRKAHGQTESTEERYWAIFLTLYSRKAEALVRSMEAIALRLRDILAAG